MRPLKSTQDAANRAGPAAAAAYTLIGAVVLLGGLGYGLDRWLDSSPWGVLGGLLLGLAVGFYELVMSAKAELKRDRYVKSDDDRPGGRSGSGKSPS